MNEIEKSALRNQKKWPKTTETGRNRFLLARPLNRHRQMIRKLPQYLTIRWIKFCAKNFGLFVYFILIFNRTRESVHLFHVIFFLNKNFEMASGDCITADIFCLTLSFSIEREKDKQFFKLVSLYVFFLQLVAFLL